MKKKTFVIIFVFLVAILLLSILFANGTLASFSINSLIFLLVWSAYDQHNKKHHKKTKNEKKNLNLSDKNINIILIISFFVFLVSVYFFLNTNENKITVSDEEAKELEVLCKGVCLENENSTKPQYFREKNECWCGLEDNEVAIYSMNDYVS